MKEKKKIEYKHRKLERNNHKSIRSLVSVSGTVSLQDCIFNGEEREEKGDYVKTNVIVAGRFSVKTFIVVFFYLGIIPEHTKY